jgi:uncharacterized membrane protein YphA (DoxX/SURF4 family)
MLRFFCSQVVDYIRSSVQMVTQAWDRFWFSKRDPTVLGIMRWLVGGMLVYTHLVRGLNLPAFFGSAGWNGPDVLAVVQEGRIVPSFLWYVSDEWLLPFHVVCITILVMFWIGLATRVTCVLSLIITISYAYRAHMANFGLDQINGILCFYRCIGPSGHALSADRLIRAWIGKKRATAAATKCIVPSLSPSVSANFAVRLIQVHFCVIYACAGLSKLQGPAWWSGEAVRLAFANLEYQSLDMTWIAWYPWVSDLMTHTTIIWEVSFAAMIWIRPVRSWVLAIGFMMHLGIGGAMGMWTFGLIMIFGHVAFWPDTAIRRVARHVPSVERLLGIVTIADALASAHSTADPVTPVRVRPALLCVDRSVRRRLECVGYFLRRGFRCMATDDIDEAHRVCEATTPDAVVVLGTQMEDEEIELFHDAHCATEDPAPLFMFLSEGQSQRLNGHIRTPKSHVITGNMSLGGLRREIQRTLGLPDEDPETDRTNAHSETGELI